MRAVITLGMSWAALRARGAGGAQADPRRQRALLGAARSGCAGLTCFYYSLVHLPLGEATLMQYTNPVWPRCWRRCCCASTWAARGRVPRGEPRRRGAGGAAGRRCSAAAARRSRSARWPSRCSGALCSAAAYVTVRAHGRRRGLAARGALPAAGDGAGDAAVRAARLGVADAARVAAARRRSASPRRSRRCSMTRGLQRESRRARDGGGLPADRVRRGVGLPRVRRAAGRVDARPARR